MAGLEKTALFRANGPAWDSATQGFWPFQLGRLTAALGERIVDGGIDAEGRRKRSFPNAAELPAAEEFCGSAGTILG